MAEAKETPRSKPETAKGQGPGTGLERGASTPHDVNPLAFMHRFAQDMDHLFEDFGLRMPGFFARGRLPRRRGPGPIPAGWAPQVEVREGEGQLSIRVDLPGLTKDDIKVEVAEDMLTIQGERKQEKTDEREGYSYSECSYGRFSRAVPLPEGADASKATAEFRNGVLEVAMPTSRRPEAKARRLEVREKT